MKLCVNDDENNRSNDLVMLNITIDNKFSLRLCNQLFLITRYKCQMSSFYHTFIHSFINSSIHSRTRSLSILVHLPTTCSPIFLDEIQTSSNRLSLTLSLIDFNNQLIRHDMAIMMIYDVFKARRLLDHPIH